MIAAFVVAIVKGEGYASLIHHRGGLIVLLAVALGFSLLRPKPLLIAAFAAGWWRLRWLPIRPGSAWRSGSARSLC